jgi:hypothetical protein
MEFDMEGSKQVPLDIVVDLNPIHHSSMVFIDTGEDYGDDAAMPNVGGCQPPLGISPCSNKGGNASFP